MQPSLPAAPKAISSIYDAIKDGDWEGLLSLYATTTYDAVHSEDFARRGVSVGVHHQQQPLLPTLMTGSNDNTHVLFHEGMSTAKYPSLKSLSAILSDIIIILIRNKIRSYSSYDEFFSRKLYIISSFRFTILLFIGCS